MCVSSDKHNLVRAAFIETDGAGILVTSRHLKVFRLELTLLGIQECHLQSLPCHGNLKSASHTQTLLGTDVTASEAGDLKGCHGCLCVILCLTAFISGC